MFVQINQNRALRRIPDHLNSAVSGAEIGGRIHAERLTNQLPHIFPRGKEKVADAHLIHGQRSGFIRADHRRSADRFAGMKLADQAAARGHTAHAVCQTQCNAHRQTFGNRHDNQCYGDHEEGKQRSDHSETGIPGKRSRQFPDCHRTDDQEDQQKHGKRTPGDCNHLSQPIELPLKRSHGVRDLRGRDGGPADFRLRTDRDDLRVCASLQHRCPPEQKIARICGAPRFNRQTASGGRFGNRFGFPREFGFIHMKIDRFQNLAVRGNFLPRLNKDHIPDNEILFGNHPESAVANCLDRLRILNPVQNLKLLPGTVFIQKSDADRKANRQQDSQALDHGARKNGDQSGGDQDQDHRIAEFFQKKFPGGLPRSGFQMVGTMLRPADNHLFCCQSLMTACILSGIRSHIIQIVLLRNGTPP